MFPFFLSLFCWLRWDIWTSGWSQIYWIGETGFEHLNLLILLGFLNLQRKGSMARAKLILSNYLNFFVHHWNLVCPCQHIFCFSIWKTISFARQERSNGGIELFFFHLDLFFCPDRWINTYLRSDALSFSWNKLYWYKYLLKRQDHVGTWLRKYSTR